MERYIVSALKYRPSTFSSVVGQKALTATLKNAIATNRLAHAYLFCGSRGVGKTSCARIFAKTINCSNPTPDGDPCNECDSCRSFNENRSLNIVELDAASNNSVDNIRNLVEQVQVPPTMGRYRVFIVDEVHMLSSAAFNAFLKTLEEPPSYVVFILATTEKHKIIPTILSRCQIYDFNRITVTDMIDHLAHVAEQEGYTAERSALGVIARKADGAMRDALSIFDQVVASTRGNVTYAATIDNLNELDTEYYNRLTEAFIAGDVSTSLLIYKEIRDKGFDSQFFITGLGAYLRDLMVARDPNTLSLLDSDEDVKKRMAEIAQRLPIEFYFAAMSLCNEADLNYRMASSKTFLVELLLIRLCQQQRPSHASDDRGEGLLKPFVVNTTATSTAAPTAQRPTGTATPQPSNDTAQHPSSSAVPTAASVAGAATAQSTAATPAAKSGVSLPPPPPPPVAQMSPSAPAPASSAVPPLGNSAPRFGNAAPQLGSTAPQLGNVSPTATGRQPRVLRSTHRAPQQAASTPETTVEAAAGNRTTPYTLEQLHAAWLAYADARPKEHILINTFHNSLPSPTDTPDTYDVALRSELEIDDLKNRLPEVLAHLRNSVNNDSIAITFSIDQSGPSALIWNDHEILEHLLSTSPEVATLISKLQLKLI